MSEYIVTCDDEVASWIGNDVDSMRPIVRCRDCKWFVPGYTDSRADDWCLKHDHIGWSYDGFCAWGVRRDAER